MDQVMTDGVGGMELGTTMERLAATAEMLEQAVTRLERRQSALSEEAESRIGHIVATVENRREVDLEQRLAAAEAKVAELSARAAVGDEDRIRKTLPPTMTTLLAKQGVTVESLEAGALDAALSSLSLEQRIAVKAQLMRAGMLG